MTKFIDIELKQKMLEALRMGRPARGVDPNTYQPTLIVKHPIFECVLFTVKFETLYELGITHEELHLPT